MAQTGLPTTGIALSMLSRPRGCSITCQGLCTSWKSLRNITATSSNQRPSHHSPMTNWKLTRMRSTPMNRGRRCSASHLWNRRLLHLCPDQRPGYCCCCLEEASVDPCQQRIYVRNRPSYPAPDHLLLRWQLHVYSPHKND